MSILKYLDYKKYINFLNRKNRENRERINMKRYNSWIKSNEPDDNELEMQSKKKFNYSPKISILVPMYNTPEKFLKELLDSVISQTYSNFELCLLDTSPNKNDNIVELVKIDKRIKYKYTGKNEGISNNTNLASKMADGDYIALLDHDDILAPFALYEVVKAINENKDVEFIYSDEDKFTTLDEPRFDPYFKPIFSLHLLRCNNYICHFTVLKKTLFNKIGGFRKEFDGAQDYDLIFRATEIAKNIIHIPKILYHWRFHSGSTASDGNNKLYAYEAGKRAIEEHLQRQNINGKITMNTNFLGLYSVEYNVDEESLVSIVIVVDRKKELKNLMSCIDSISKSTYKKYEIIIISKFLLEDNILKLNNRIKFFIYSDKYNYSNMINFGVNKSSGDYIVLLDVNTEIFMHNWLEKMLGVSKLNDVSIVGPKCITPNNNIFNTSLIIGREYCKNDLNSNLNKDEYGYFSYTLCNRNLSAINDICMMISKKDFINVGELSNKYSGSLAFEDLCIKINKQLSKQIVYNSAVEVCYKGRGQRNNIFDTLRFKKEWRDVIINGDPYFNKNLTVNKSLIMIKNKKVD